MRADVHRTRNPVDAFRKTVFFLPFQPPHPMRFHQVTVTWWRHRRRVCGPPQTSRFRRRRTQYRISKAICGSRAPNALFSSLAPAEPPGGFPSYEVTVTLSLRTQGLPITVWITFYVRGPPVPLVSLDVKHRRPYVSWCQNGIFWPLNGGKP